MESSRDPLVSVIIPCYNQGIYVDEAIQSVLNSSYQDIEIIIINDGSTDDYTNKLLESQKWEKTVIYSIQNAGVANARNFGIKKSSGEYILPLDADDKISDDYIEKAVAILSTDPEIKIVYCQVEMFGIKHGKYPLPDHSMEMILAQNTMVVSSFFKRTDFEKTSGFNSDMKIGFEDWDFWLSLLEEDNKVYRINKTCFYYRIKRRSRNTSIGPEVSKILRKQIFLNHQNLYAKYPFFPTDSFEYHLVFDSKEYKLGKLLLFPIRLLLNKLFN